MLMRLLKAWLPVVIVCVAIFLFSQDAHSGRHSDEVLSWVLTVLGANTPHWHRLLDGPFRKLAHVVVYFVLGLVTYRGFAMGRRGFGFAAAMRSLIFCAVYATTDEYHQALVPGRGPSIRDVSLDTAAALLALFILWLWLRPRARHHELEAVPESDIHCSGS